MTSKAIKPATSPISEVPLAPGPKGQVADMPAPTITMPELMTPPAWTAASITYALALPLIIGATIFIVEEAFIARWAGIVEGANREAAIRIGALIAFLVMILGIAKTTLELPAKA